MRTRTEEKVRKRCVQKEKMREERQEMGGEKGDVQRQSENRKQVNKGRKRQTR